MDCRGLLGWVICCYTLIVIFLLVFLTFSYNRGAVQAYRSLYGCELAISSKMVGKLVQSEESYAPQAYKDVLSQIDNCISDGKLKEEPNAK